MFIKKTRGFIAMVPLVGKRIGSQIWVEVPDDKGEILLKSSSLYVKRKDRVVVKPEPVKTETITVSDELLIVDMEPVSSSYELDESRNMTKEIEEDIEKERKPKKVLKSGRKKSFLSSFKTDIDS